MTGLVHLLIFLPLESDPMKTTVLFSPFLLTHIRLRLLAFLCLTLPVGTFAQLTESGGYTHNLLSASTGYSGTGANIDVKYHRLEWRFHPDSPSALSPAKFIKGAVTTYFLTTVGAVSQISFDLNKNSFNNASLSVYYHGSPVSFSFPSSGAVNVITITLPATLGSGVLDSLTINYAGSPPAVSGQAEGFQRGPASATNNYYYTLSESYEDRDWWPCKADMQDKIDSVDFVISVPSSFWAAAPGTLVDSAVNGSNRTLIYKHRYPIATYLVAIGVAKYVKYYRGTIAIGGKDIPVAYYLFPGKTAGTYTNILNALDNAKLEVTAFSDKFGEYPFKNEKHGYYEFGWGGGMEHQSFSAMGSGVLTSWSVIAHELAHQWFGDKVTFATWNHLWLAEGFAKYMEPLAAELVPSLGQNPVTLRNSIKNTALSTSTTPVYLSNASIANSNTIWTTANDNAVYQRGAMIVSSLRTLVGDSLFYLACRNYLDDPALAYQSATTNDLRYHFEQVLGGFDLTPFFDDFVYGTGNPIYQIYWGTNAVSKRINIQVASQSRSASSTVAYFNTPIALRVQGSNAVTMDTTIVVYDNNGTLHFAGDGIKAGVSGTIISRALSFVPVTVTYDPFHQTLATGTTQQQSYLNVSILQFEGVNVGTENLLKATIVSDRAEIIKLTWQKSTDGIHYQDMDAEEREMVEMGKAFFSYKDPVDPGAQVYYRLKLEQTASILYSRVISLTAPVMALLQVFPNPASGKVQVQTKGIADNKSLRVELVSNRGVVVRSFNLHQGGVSFETAALPAGIYQLRLFRNQEFITGQSLVIIK